MTTDREFSNVIASYLFTQLCECPVCTSSLLAVVRQVWRRSCAVSSVESYVQYWLRRWPWRLNLEANTRLHGGSGPGLTALWRQERGFSTIRTDLVLDKDMECTTTTRPERCFSPCLPTGIEVSFVPVVLPCRLIAHCDWLQLELFAMFRLLTNWLICCTVVLQQQCDSAT